MCYILFQILLVLAFMAVAVAEDPLYYRGSYGGYYGPAYYGLGQYSSGYYGGYSPYGYHGLRYLYR
jgi:hypothetical protein